MKYIIIFFILITNFLYSEDIRILIKSSSKSISFKANNFRIIDEMVGDKLLEYNNSKNIVVSISTKEGQNGLTVLGKFYPTKGLIFESKNNFSIGSYKLKFKLLISVYDKKIYAINLLPVESYLAGIIHTEISPTWPKEAIKAQIVVSRTYALRKKINNLFKPYDLGNSVLSQVYRGMGMVRESSVKMVSQTYGEVITYKHKLIEAFFHSNSGGITQDGSYFSGKNIKYLQSVNDEKYIKNLPKTNWVYNISKNKFYKLLKKYSLIKGNLKKISVIKRSNSNRILKLRLISSIDKIISGEKLRMILGYSNLSSTNFIIKSSSSKLIFEGKGYGHGVGMSQWGAYAMAKAGKNYKKIINNYFKNISIVKMY